MNKYLRFHDVSVELFWDGKLVGKVKIQAKRALSLNGGATTNLVGPSLSDTNGNDTTGVGPIAGNVVESDPAPLNGSAAFSVPPDVTFGFSDITGANAVRRNDVFLTIYAAFLHMAQFPVGSQALDFDGASPNGKLSLHVQQLEPGCQVRREPRRIPIQIKTK